MLQVCNFLATTEPPSPPCFQLGQPPLALFSITLLRPIFLQNQKTTPKKLLMEFEGPKSIILGYFFFVYGNERNLWVLTKKGKVVLIVPPFSSFAFCLHASNIRTNRHNTTVGTMKRHICYLFSLTISIVFCIEVLCYSDLMFKLQSSSRL